MEDDVPVRGINVELAPKFFEQEEAEDNQGRTAEQVTFTHVFERLGYDAEGCLYQYFKDCKYPVKGMPSPKALWAIDIAKKITMGYVMTLASKEMILPAIGFALLPWKYKVRLAEKALVRYFHLANYILSSNRRVYRKPQHYTHIAKAFRGSISCFLFELGITQETSNNIAKVFCNMIEYDDAYRYRTEDMMSAVTFKEMYDDPRKAIRKVLATFKERDRIGLYPKFKSYANILDIALRLPKIKRAFRKAISSVDFRHFQFDNVDRYNATLTTGYDYFGMTDQQRVDMWIDWHDGNIPERIKVIS